MYDEIRTPLISDTKQTMQCYDSLNDYEKIKVIMHTKPLKFSKCIRDMYVLCRDTIYISPANRNFVCNMPTGTVTKIYVL